MRVVVIQGRTLACYVGRKQVSVIEIDDWDDWDGDYRGFIEDYRVRGDDAL